MRFSHKLIPKINHTGWPDNYFISTDAIVLLIIANLHINKLITDAKMLGMIRSLREGNFIRHVKTYHCKLNDTWYNDESTFRIYLEAYNEPGRNWPACPKTNVEFESFLKYLNLYLNKNRNFCIDWIYFQMVEPLIRSSSSYHALNQLRSFDVEEFDDTFLTFEEADRKHELGFGHCCEDCDGDYTQYKLNRYERMYLDNIEEKAKNVFKEFLFNKKTADAFRNPKEKLMARV